MLTPQPPFAVTIHAVENGWHWCVRDGAGGNLAAGLSSDQAIAHVRARAVLAEVTGQPKPPPQVRGTSFSP